MLPTTNASSVSVIDINSYAQSKKKRKKQMPSKEKERKILDGLQDNMSRWSEYFAVNLQRFREDRRFYRGTQWNSQELTQYEQILGKRAYTNNHVKIAGRMLCGEQMNMQPKLTLLADSMIKPDPQKVIFMNKFLRAIAYDSSAHHVYNAAFNNQLVGGWGIAKIETDYESPYKFDQKIKIVAIEDPLNIGFDPNSKSPHKTDGDFQFQYETMSKDEFKAKYKNAKVPVGTQFWGQSSQDFLPMRDDNSVIVVQYYLKEYKSKTLVQLTNNEHVNAQILEEDVEKFTLEYEQSMIEQGFLLEEIPPLIQANKRPTKLAFIKCYTCTSEEILDAKDWPIDAFPFVFIDAFSQIDNGRQYTESWVYNARDAQKNHNYAISEIMNGLARTRKEQVWMTRTQAEGHEDFLRYPDRQQGHGEFNPDPEQPGGPIFRPPEELPQSLSVVSKDTLEQIYRTLGLSEMAMGGMPAQTSGVAATRMIIQANLPFKKLLQNLYSGMEEVGRIVLKLIPKIYDTERVVSMLDERGQAETEIINEVNASGVKNSLTDLSYKLHVEPVASFAIQQEMVRDEIFKTIQAIPQLGPLLGEVVLGTLPVPEASLMAERAQSLVPPNILRKEQNLPPLPPQPNPQEEIAKAALMKTHAETQKIYSDIAVNENEVEIKHQKVVEEGQNAADKNNLEAMRIGAENQEKAANVETSYIKADAEIENAKLQHNMSAMKILADINREAGRAAKDSNKKES